MTNLQTKYFFILIILTLISILKLDAQDVAINNEGHLILKYSDNSFKYMDIYKLDKETLKDIDKQIVQNYFRLRANAFEKIISDSKNALELDILYKSAELEDYKLNKEDYEDEIKKTKLEIKFHKKQLNDIKDLQEKGSDNIKMVQSFKTNNPKKLASNIRSYLSKEINEEDWALLYNPREDYQTILNDVAIYAENLDVEKAEVKDVEVASKPIEEEIFVVKEEKREIKEKKKKRTKKRKEKEEIKVLNTDKEKIVEKEIEKQKKKVEKEIIKEESILTDVDEHNVDSVKFETPVSQKNFSYTILPNNRKYKKEPKNANKIITPPAYTCAIEYEGVDELTNKKRKDLKTERLFSFTPDNLKNILKENDYMVCDGHFSKITGGFRFLFLEIKIKSRSAKVEYGKLDKGNMLSLRLLNDKTYKVRSGISSDGIYDPKTGYTTYKTQYKLTSDLYSKLKESPLDKIRIIWSTGYEDYEIYNIDFLINQLECL